MKTQKEDPIICTKHIHQYSANPANLPGGCPDCDTEQRWKELQHRREKFQPSKFAASAIWLISALLMVASLTEGAWWALAAWLLCTIGAWWGGRLM